MKTTTLKPKELKTSHKAVAPVIATLLMVAIAVVGGTIIFVFSQGFFSSSQISGTPQIESLRIEGYDARAVVNIQMHNGNTMGLPPGPLSTSGNGDSNVQSDERIAVYVTNNSVQKIVLGEISLGGYIYEYKNVAAAGLELWDAAPIDAGLNLGNYTVLTGTSGPAGIGDVLLDEGSGEIKPGQTATIILDLESDLRIGRSTQFKLTTSNGNVFVGSLSVGQQSG
jgi:hypothetical protein